MITCDLCGFENIEGVDVCEQCGQPLHDKHLRSPQNAAETGLIKDRVNSLSPKEPIAVPGSTTVREVLALRRFLRNGNFDRWYPGNRDLRNSPGGEANYQSRFNGRVEK